MNSLPADIEEVLQESQPLIILGMHRSGTSLLVRMLADAELHMGGWLSRDAEAVHFQRLNRRIYAATGSRWGEVGALIEAMGSESFVGKQTEALRRALFHDRPLLGRDPLLARFFGPDLWRKVCQHEPVAWGWKDPRTSLTFPIWLRLFSSARWVHAVRNGIDVAISLRRRSLRQRRNLLKRTLPGDYSPSTLDLGYSFRLWEAYVSFILDHVHLLPADRQMLIRYEDLLSEPCRELRRITDFAACPAGDDALVAACTRVDRSRLDNSSYAAAHRDEIPTLASSALMQRLGYDYSMP